MSSHNPIPAFLTLAALVLGLTYLDPIEDPSRMTQLFNTIASLRVPDFEMQQPFTTDYSPRSTEVQVALK